VPQGGSGLGFQCLSVWDLACSPSGTAGTGAGFSGLSSSVRRGEFPVALYMYQVSYTAEAVAAQVKEPQDRIEAVRPVIEAMGGKLVAAGYPLGEYERLSCSRHPMTQPRPALRWPLPLAAQAGRLRPPGCSVARNGLSRCAKPKGLCTGRHGNSAVLLQGWIRRAWSASGSPLVAANAGNETRASTGGP
jgi:uncharacterized protein with GYD domain